MTSPLHDPAVRGFASDNYSGVHPEVLAAIAAANGGHQVAYGEDDYTARLREVCQRALRPEAEVFPVFNGTGANVVGAAVDAAPLGRRDLRASPRTSTSTRAARPSGSAGIKLLTVPTHDGKLTPELIDREAWGWGDEHRAQPLVVSHHPVHRARHALHARRDARDRRRTPTALGMRCTWTAPASPTPRHRSACRLRDVHHRRRRRRPLLRRHQERRHARRGHRRAQPRRSAGLDEYLRKLNMQLASKMRFVSRPADRAARRRPVAAQRRRTPTRWPRGSAPRWHGRRRRRARPPDAGQRRLRRAAQRRGRRAARALPLLRLGPRRGRGALDVLLRHHRGRHRRLRRGAQGRNGSALGPLSAGPPGRREGWRHDANPLPACLDATKRHRALDSPCELPWTDISSAARIPRSAGRGAPHQLPQRIAPGRDSGTCTACPLRPGPGRRRPRARAAQLPRSPARQPIRTR